MLTKFKMWVYGFVREGLAGDDTLIRVLYNKLEDEKRFRAKDIRQRADAVRILDGIKKHKDNCSHLKGGYGVKSATADFCISDHRFPDGTREVTCLICAKKVDPE